MPIDLLAGIFPVYTIANYGQLKQINCSFEIGQPLTVTHRFEEYAPYAVDPADVVISIQDHAGDLMSVMKLKDDYWVNAYWDAVKNGYATLNCDASSSKGMIIEAIKQGYWEIALEMITYSTSAMRNTTNNIGMNALCMASVVGAEDVVDTLLGCRNINVHYEFEGKTAAELAHGAGYHDIAIKIEDYLSDMMGDDDGLAASAA